MKVLVFGAGGMLGHKLVQKWNDRFEVFATLHREFDDFSRFGILPQERCVTGVDVTKPEDIARAVNTVRPDVVFNAVGIIKQQPSSKNVVNTLEVNAIFPHRLAEICRPLGIRVMTVSTDCVFAGKSGNYKESETPDAQDLYGISKRLGEVTDEGCLTVRTSIIGRELRSAHGLVEWFLSNRGGRVKGFSKAVFSGFPTVVLADIIADLIVSHPHLSGLYHVSAEPIDKFTLLSLVNEHFDAGIIIDRDDDFAIDRSLNSDRFRETIGFVPPAWDELVRLMADDAKHYDDWRK